MLRNEIRIVIVEDDQTLGQALLQAVKGAGFQAMHYTRPDDVVANARFVVSHLYIIDCMLPKMAGVTLAEKIREMGLADSSVVLMSGIYKDKSFIREALHKTGAKAFLTKPFNLEDLLGEIERILGGIITIEAPDDPFTEILFNKAIKPGDRLKAIESTKTVHGFEIPRVVNLIMARTISGVLGFKSSGTDPINIHISNGAIVKVEMNMPNSLFGALVLEKNLVTPEELKPILNEVSKEPLGERLVKQNLMSPHIINIINTEQMGVRLAELIKDTTYEMGFTSAKVPSGDTVIDPIRISPYLSDWVTSKIPTKWLKTFYISFLDNSLLKTEEFNDTHPLLTLSPINQLPEFLQKISTGTVTINELLANDKYAEDDVLGAVHLLILGGLFVFDRTRRLTGSNEQVERYRRLESDLRERTHFEVLGVSTNAKPSDIKKAYHDLAKNFHPDKLSQSASDDLKELTKSIFAKMTVAYEILKDEKQKELYLKELEHGQATKVLASEGLIEEGKAFLKANQPMKAAQRFKEAAEMRPPNSELLLYHNWARLITLQFSQTPQKDLNEIQGILNKIPTEDRRTPLYYFVKGLFQKYLGEAEQAGNNFKHALFLEPSFKEAERELNVIQLQKSGAGGKGLNLLHGNISDVVTSIFKKKK